MYYKNNPAVLESDDLGELRSLETSQGSDGTQLVTMTFTVNGKTYPVGEKPQHVALTNGVSHRLLPVPPHMPAASELTIASAPEAASQETAPAESVPTLAADKASEPASEIVTPEISDDAAGTVS